MELTEEMILAEMMKILKEEKIYVVKTMTLNEIGIKFGFTKERAMQILHAALKKMSKHKELKELLYD